MHQRGRRRDVYIRFLPREPINLNEELGEFELPFVDAILEFPSTTLSIEDPFDPSNLWSFAKILASFRDNSTPSAPFANNPLVVIIYQLKLHSQLPTIMAQPTFPFPLPSLINNANLKNIPTIALPKFYGLITKDPDTFSFEFDILCQSFDYNTDNHKLKLFLATLKSQPSDGLWD